MKVWQNGDVMNATTLNQAFGEMNATGVYSTERTQIGTWLGQPYYRQVVPITCSGSSTIDEATITVGENETLVFTHIYGATVYAFHCSIPITLSDLDENNRVKQMYFRVSQNGRVYFFHTTGNNWEGKVVYAILEYFIAEETPTQ